MLNLNSILNIYLQKIILRGDYVSVSILKDILLYIFYYLSISGLKHAAHEPF